MAGFKQLLVEVAQGWLLGDADRALASFAPDAVYMEPPDRQLFVGHPDLESYFAAVERGTRMTWHGMWFDDATQSGAAEFTFGDDGQPVMDHGVAVLELRDGRIASWQEYVVKGPPERAEFLATEGKAWRWHGAAIAGR